jgi:proliferating cell nuclear antigen
LFFLDEDRTCEFELKLMDVDSEHLGIPDTPYDVVVKMPSAEFQRICRDISVMSESVTIDVIKEGIRFSASGDSGKGSVSLKPSSGSIDEESDRSVSIEMNAPVSMTFSLKYLTNFTKATALSEFVNLSMSEGIPMLVEYKAHDAGYIR